MKESEQRDESLNELINYKVIVEHPWLHRRVCETVERFSFPGLVNYIQDVFSPPLKHPFMSFFAWPHSSTKQVQAQGSAGSPLFYPHLTWQ